MNVVDVGGYWRTADDRVVLWARVLELGRERVVLLAMSPEQAGQAVDALVGAQVDGGALEEAPYALGVLPGGDGTAQGVEGEVSHGG